MDCGGRVEGAGEVVGVAGADLATVADVAVLGAGFAGALCALVLARRGFRVVVVDLHAAPPPEFRCEKLGADQVARLARLGVLDAFQGLASPGEPIAERLTTRGLRYDALVAAAREAWPARVSFVQGRVRGVEAVADGPATIVLADSARVRARLVVLATGGAERLRHDLGLEREVLREPFSTTIGFDLAPGPSGRAPPTGVFPGERAGNGVAYASLFPLDGAARVNLFTHLDPRDPRVHAFRRDPLAALAALAPGLARRLADAEVEGEAEVRAVGLVRTTGAAEAGLVVIGDAFMTSCPSTGTGVTRILNDIERLADAFAPAWLADPAPVAPRLATFYADPQKRAVDAASLAASQRARRGALETSPAWRARRLAVRVRAALRRARAPKLAAAAFARGDWVEVKSVAEIAASLDANGARDGLPFMPEMAALCGRRLRVHRRADKLCVEGLGLRTLGDAVLLEGARCDGAQHDGCQRGCLMVWREAWLRPVAGPAFGAMEPIVEAAAAWAPVRRGALYNCQSTALATCTTGPLGRWGLGHLLRDVRGGELDARDFLAIVGRGLLNNARRALGLRELGQLTGEAARPDKGALDLRPGEWVRIRPPAAIRTVLDGRGRNRGLSFEPEMTGYAGQLHRVEAQVTRIIHEETGRMVKLERTVSLQGLDCRGSCAKNCPRANPLYWRESWLERAEAPTGA